MNRPISIYCLSLFVALQPTLLVLNSAAAQSPTVQLTADQKKAMQLVKSACLDPKQVNYTKPTKNKSGQKVYYRYLIDSRSGKKYFCSAFGVGPVKNLPKELSQTEAGLNADCKNCPKPADAANMSKLLEVTDAVAPVCTPNSQSWGQCAGDFACTLTQDIMRVATNGLSDLPALKGKKLIPYCKNTKSNASCAQKVILGLGNGIKDLVVGLLSLAWKGVTGIVGLTLKTLGAASKDTFNAARNFFSNKKVHRTDHTASMVLRWIQKLPNSEFVKFLKDPINKIWGFIKRLYFDSLETSKALANCKEWSGVPYFSKCKSPAPLWACLNCNEKTETVCGLIGIAATDIASIFLAGATVGKIAAKVGHLTKASNRIIVRTTVKKLGKDTARRVFKVTGTIGAGAAALGSGTLYVAKPVLWAFSQIEKIPGFKQYSQVEGKAFYAGLVTGGGKKAAQRIADIADTSADTADSASEAIVDSIAEDLASSDAIILDTTTRSPLALRSRDEFIAEVRRSNPTIEEVDQNSFIARHSKRPVVSEAENKKFIEVMNETSPPSGRRYFVFRDVAKKAKNDTYGYDHSTAITTHFVDTVNTRVKLMQPELSSSVTFRPYEGANRYETIADAAKGSTGLPKGFRERMVDSFKQSAAEQELFLKQNGLVKPDEKVSQMFSYGEGPTAYTANLTGRINKGFPGHISTLHWESRPLQASAQILFQAGKEAHKSFLSRYRGTALVDASTGRIAPHIADIVSRAKTRQDVIEKLKPFYQFTDAQGRPLPLKSTPNQIGQLDLADELIEYVESARFFSAEFYGPRTFLALEKKGKATLIIDLRGQNGRNISHNADIFNDSFENLEKAALRAEDASTQEFKRIMSTAIKNIEDVLARNGFSPDKGYIVKHAKGGDELEFTIEKADGSRMHDLPEKVLQEIADINDANVPLRNTYSSPFVSVSGPRGEIQFLDKQKVADLTHALEKDLRVVLRSRSPLFEQRNFAIDVNVKGEMSLRMSRPANMSDSDWVSAKKIADDEFAKIVEGRLDELEGLRLKKETGTLEQIKDVVRQQVSNLFSSTSAKPIREATPVVKYDFDELDPQLKDTFIADRELELGRKISPAEAREIYEFAKLKPHGLDADRGPLREAIQRSIFFTPAEQFILLRKYGNYGPLSSQRSILEADMKAVTESNRKKGVSSASLDKPGKATFTTLERLTKKIESKFEFLKPEDRDLFFRYRYFDPKGLSRSFDDYLDLSVSPVSKGSFSAEDVIQRDYETVLFVADNLGQSTMSDFAKKSGHIDTKRNLNLFSLRLNLVPDFNRETGVFKKLTDPNLRAILCKLSNGKILVLSTYSKQYHIDDPGFAQFETSIYEKAVQDLKARGIKCIPPI